MRHVFGDKPLKNYRLWLLIGFLSYSLGGFLLLPYVLKTQLIHYVDDTLQQKARLETVSFNPFLFRLRLQSLQLATSENAPLLKLGELVVDFDTFGLFKRAWQFSTVSFSELEVFAEIDSAGNLNLLRLVPPSSNEAQTPPKDKTQAALPRLILNNIALNQSRVHFRQLDRIEPFNLDLNALNFNIAHFSTLPEDGGQFNFTAQLSDTESLTFSGDLQVEPLVLAAHVELDNIELKRGGNYLQEMLLFTINQGTLSLNSDFTLDNSGPEGGLALQATNIGLELQQLRLDTLAPAEPLLRIDNISLNQASFAWPEQLATAESLVVDNGSFHSWMTANKVFNYSQLIKNSEPQVEADTDSNASPASPALQLRLDKVQLTALQLHFTDRSLREPALQSVDIVNFALNPFTLKEGDEFDLQAQLRINTTGKTDIAGKVGTIPPMAALTIDLQGLPLPPINNYLHDTIQLSLTQGSIDADLQLDYQNPDSQALRLRGDIDIREVDSLNLVNQEEWARWENLAIKTLDFQLEPASLNIASVEFIAPHFETIVFENGETNLSRMLVPAPKQAASAPDATEASSTTTPSPVSTEKGTIFPVAIAKFTLNDGTLIYKDFNLPINFTTHIHSLHGQVLDISTASSTPTELFLDGKIDRNGTAKISAASQLSAPHAFSKFKLDLSNIDITSASGYSGKFAGYAIDAGTLALNLDYRIEQGQMHGDNQLLLESLTLGDTVDSPDAVSLPLKLAVALMKDVNGNIDIDLPVQGDLNNPKVQISGIVWKAFRNLLVKVVSSPFKMLSGLFESASDSNLDNIAFAPGVTTLVSSEQQKLNKLTQALRQKPALALNVNACYQPESDGPALQTLAFNQLYKTTLGDEELSDKPISYQSEVLETLYSKTFGGEKLTALKTRSEQLLSQKTTENSGNEDLSTLIAEHIDEQMQQQLIEQQTIDTTQFLRLARERAQGVFNYLTKNKDEVVDTSLKPSRIQLEENVVKLGPDATAIACPLSLSAL